MDSVEEYWHVVSSEKPLFEIGMIYDDSSRPIEILCVSTQLDTDPEHGWKYLCKVKENSNGFVDYYTFDETDMKFIHLADINCYTENLSEKELIIREITTLCGGIFNTDNQYFPDIDTSKTCATTPRYHIGYEELHQDDNI